MRRGIASFLRNLADRIHRDEKHEFIEIDDEYGICRCKVSLTTDAAHHIDSAFTDLPRGWVYRTEDS